MKKRGKEREKFIFCFEVLISLIIFSGYVSAISVSMSDVSSNLATVSISGASNLYSYEVDLDYSGSISSVTFASFLSVSSGDTTSGHSERSSISSVYESRTDSGQTGISGNGDLFNVTHSGSLSLRYALFVYNDGSEVYVYYNTSAQPPTGGGDSVTAGAGSGASGATTPTEIKPVEGIKLDTEQISIDLTLKESKERIIRITNRGEQEKVIEISQEGLDKIVSFGKTSITLKPKESVDIRVIFASLENAGISTGKIIIGGNKVLVSVNTRTSPLLFDVSIAVADFDKVIKIGDKLDTQVSLMPMGDKPRVDVTINYIIKDFDGKTYLQESETFLVEKQTTLTKQFFTTNLPEGDYVVGMEVIYPNGVATSSSHFKIAKEIPLKLKIVPIALLALILILIFFIIIVMVRYKKHRKRLLRKK